jgi:hypothetical protein
MQKLIGMQPQPLKKQHTQPPPCAYFRDAPDSLPAGETLAGTGDMIGDDGLAPSANAVPARASRTARQIPAASTWHSLASEACRHLLCRDTRMEAFIRGTRFI